MQSEALKILICSLKWNLSLSFHLIPYHLDIDIYYCTRVIDEESEAQRTEHSETKIKYKMSILVPSKVLTKIKFKYKNKNWLTS